jgi:uncharacterized protein with ParB-like and HNH nuclease domain
MPFQTPLTIEKVLDRIQAQEYVLPAIQREFAWDTDQVIRLFDSLMRGYPIGAFLFWKVKGRDPTADDGDRDFVFYGFIRAYHELKSPHCPRLDVPKSREVTAILDGQQRPPRSTSAFAAATPRSSLESGAAISTPIPRSAST